MPGRTHGRTTRKRWWFRRHLAPRSSRFRTTFKNGAKWCPISAPSQQFRRKTEIGSGKAIWHPRLFLSTHTFRRLLKTHCFPAAGLRLPLATHPRVSQIRLLADIVHSKYWFTYLLTYFSLISVWSKCHFGTKPRRRRRTAWRVRQPWDQRRPATRWRSWWPCEDCARGRHWGRRACCRTPSAQLSSSVN